MPINYQKILEATLAELSAGKARPQLLLHACCAPCASYVLAYLAPYFQITLFFYNPNIYPPAEYDRRLQELHRFCAAAHSDSDIRFLTAPYQPEEFFAAARGLEDAPEGGQRCRQCFTLRLTRTAEAAAAIGADYFTTTLSISPHKDAALLNTIGQTLAQQYHVPYLCSDFKKKDGYKQSIALSRQYGLYRQNYCGCLFSARQSDER